MSSFRSSPARGSSAPSSSRNEKSSPKPSSPRLASSSARSSSRLGSRPRRAMPSAEKSKFSPSRASKSRPPSFAPCASSSSFPFTGGLALGPLALTTFLAGSTVSSPFFALSAFFFGASAASTSTSTTFAVAFSTFSTFSFGAFFTTAAFFTAFGLLSSSSLFLACSRSAYLLRPSTGYSADLVSAACKRPCCACCEKLSRRIILPARGPDMKEATCTREMM
mmetsp:Transcript_5832/g.12864  ORF Transcript_5832/g.12864 Transcript_5832/m.12864 type:complete len:222 (-) Transcript_5832:188-853(-)